MDWENYRYLLAVQRTGSLRAAARELNVNQSTLSRHIAAFEAELGVRLLDRVPNGVAFTEAGRELVEAAGRADDELSIASRTVAGRDLEIRGRLRATVADVTFVRFLAPMVAEFTRLHPEIELELVSGYDFLSLSRHEADVAVRIARNPPEGLYGHRLARVELAIYAAAELVEGLGGAVDLAAVPWIGWTTDRLDRQMRLDRFPEARIRYRVDSALMLVEAVRSGVGVSTFSCYHGDRDPALRRVGSWQMAGRASHLWLLTHRDLRRTARVRAFIKFMRAALAPHHDLIEGRCPLHPPAPV